MVSLPYEFPITSVETRNLKFIASFAARTQTICTVNKLCWSLVPTHSMTWKWVIGWTWLLQWPILLQKVAEAPMFERILGAGQVPSTEVPCIGRHQFPVVHKLWYIQWTPGVVFLPRQLRTLPLEAEAHVSVTSYPCKSQSYPPLTLSNIAFNIMTQIRKFTLIRFYHSNLQTWIPFYQLNH